MSKNLYSGIAIINARGKLNNKVLTRNRGGNISRAYVIPTNTISSAKTDVHNLLTAVSQQWALIPQENRDAWNLACLDRRKTDNIGNHYYSSGFNMFVQETFNIFAAGNIPSFLPVPHIIRADIINVQCAISLPDTMSFTVTFNRNGNKVPNDCVLVVACSSQVSAGINYKRSDIPIFTGYPSGFTIINSPIGPTYVSVHGALISGKRIFFKVWLLNGLTGQPCTKHFFSFLVP